ncbi:MAG: GNAT family protein [candidate division KSB1 bacterium]|nr:GNAT family protein [candidate division KSB1 bacterium]
MILETDKIKIELTRLDNIRKIIQIENENSDFIGQYDFDRHKGVIDSDDEMHLSVFDKIDNSLIGHIILAGLKSTNDSIEFRRIVISNKGKGFGKDSIDLIKKYCFKELNTNRIWLDVFQDNYRAIRLYKSRGFKTEGVLREIIKQNGQYHSLKIMSILKNDSENEIPSRIDHICLIVKDINKTRSDLQSLFNLEIKTKPDSENVLMCENKNLHFFVKQMDFSTKFLREQHLSLTVDNIKLISDKLKSRNIDFEIGEFNGFRYNNYKWIEWRDDNEIRFECIEEI